MPDRYTILFYVMCISLGTSVGVAIISIAHGSALFFCVGVVLALLSAAIINELLLRFRSYD